LVLFPRRQLLGDNWIVSFFTHTYQLPSQADSYIPRIATSRQNVAFPGCDVTCNSTSLSAWKYHIAGRVSSDPAPRHRRPRVRKHRVVRRPRRQPSTLASNVLRPGAGVDQLGLVAHNSVGDRWHQIKELSVYSLLRRR